MKLSEFKKGNLIIRFLPNARGDLAFTDYPIEFLEMVESVCGVKYLFYGNPGEFKVRYLNLLIEHQGESLWNDDKWILFPKDAFERLQAEQDADRAALQKEMARED